MEILLLISYHSPLLLYLPQSDLLLVDVLLWLNSIELWIIVGLPTYFCKCTTKSKSKME